MPANQIFRRAACFSGTLAAFVFTFGAAQAAPQPTPTPAAKHANRPPKHTPPKKHTVPAPHKATKPVAHPTPAPKKPIKKAVPAVARPVAPHRPTLPTAVNSVRVGALNTPYALGGAQVTLQKGEFTNKGLPNLFGSNPPDAGTRYVVFALAVKNISTTPLDWNFDRFNPKLQTANATDAVLRGNSLLNESDDKYDARLIAPGDEKTIHFHFQVPSSAALKTLTFSGSGGTYAFDVSGVH